MPTLSSAASSRSSTRTAPTSAPRLSVTGSDRKSCVRMMSAASPRPASSPTEIGSRTMISASGVSGAAVAISRSATTPTSLPPSTTYRLTATSIKEPLTKANRMDDATRALVARFEKVCPAKKQRRFAAVLLL